ncbi:RING-H2 finger protein ATL70-like [Cynara cardunculus var. scolymus]|uniref:RING-H2 finger protein ATL70-like n=1 Tax=Cynara cardunculus var. scolymus TaxID=59895 RepID=UPI000D624888|nr:RING-H2 finger protein ATL70-like [Cynara cardunculus var. scolymus]
MNVTQDSVQPPYTTTTTTGKSQGISDYLFVVGFFVLILLLLTLTFTSYICKRSRSPPPTISFGATIHNNVDHRLITISPGLDDDVLLTFPTFLYSQATMAHKGVTPADANASGCSVCLADYKLEDVVRLLPECGHLFHVNCIDTWLKVHPTCPVCRNSPVAKKVPPLLQQLELTGQ